ncbi:MAG: dTDP-glucose 4,6-dehydratase [Acidobacteria bacterium]|nr:MAG: dTDP-glucose 4,6-dehydratase [Acidobacteriota bacterium]
MKSLLITGGAGFIGSNMVQKTLAKGIRTVVLDKLTYAGNPNNLAHHEENPLYRFYKGDIGDSRLVSKILKDHDIDAILNFAAESHVDRSIDGPAEFIQTNIVGTFRLLQATLEYWRELGDQDRETFRFLHVSTDEVYGSLGATGYFMESTPYAPNSPYSASKASSDHLVRAYIHTYGLPCITTNCSNNYGPYQFPEKLIPVIIMKALKGDPIPIYGDGKNIRDWLYVEDHCEGILTAIQKGKVGETYNIGGDSERTNLDIVHYICRILDERFPEKEEHAKLITFVPDRPGHDRRYAIDASKIKSELGWQPSENFETGMKKTVEWYLKNLDWCETILSGDYQLERLGLN